MNCRATGSRRSLYALVGVELGRVGGAEGLPVAGFGSESRGMWVVGAVRMGSLCC